MSRRSQKHKPSKGRFAMLCHVCRCRPATNAVIDTKTMLVVAHICDDCDYPGPGGDGGQSIREAA